MTLGRVLSTLSGQTIIIIIMTIIMIMTIIIMIITIIMMIVTIMVNNQYSAGSCQPTVGRQLGTRREGEISEAGPLVKIIIICLITIIIMIFL